MTQQTTEERTGGSSFDPGRLIVVAILVVGSLLVLSFARSRVVAPFDRAVTERTCVQEGEDMGRRLIAYERSNRLALTNRTDGFCRFGPDSGGSPSLTVPLSELETGPIYRASKWLGVIMQLGIVSLFLRLAVEPLMAVYERVRHGL